MLLTEPESKALLKKAGIKINETQLATSKEQAVSLSEQFGFPVALKIVSPDIIHKSDSGGVKLGLKTIRQVAKAYDDIMDKVSKKYPDAVIQGVSVQKMARPGIEVIIGMFNDTQFGPVIMFGLGGIWVEVLKDVTFGIIPITEHDAVRMIGEIRGYSILQGYRGQEAADIAILAGLLTRISGFVEQHPEVKELELNPVFAYSDDAIAVDARIVVEDKENKAESVRSLAPRNRDLAELFSPRSIAVVGVSLGREFSFGSNAIQILKKAGFPEIYPVNPKYTEVLGLPCYHNLQSIPGIVDHVIANIPAESALKLLEDCSIKGVKSVHFFTAGFSEVGDPKQAELEKMMLGKARAGNFRIIGPNCIGPISPKSRLITIPFAPHEPGNIAFLSQSGGYTEDLCFFGGPRGLRFSKLMSYGNALDVGESELIEYFSQDPDTEIIGAYIEGVKNGRLFFEALKKATMRKPVVIQKGGTTEAGQRAAFSHTASLATSVSVFNAVCRQLNVIQVDDFEELTDMLVALRFIKPAPEGTGTAIVGTGGGPSVFASDAVEKAGLHLPPLPPEAQTRLRQFLPLAGGILTNPVDAVNLTVPEAIYRTLCVLGAVDDIHTLIYHMGFHPTSHWGDGRLSTPAYLSAMVDALKQAQQAIHKPILVTLRPAMNTAEMKDFLAVQAALVEARFPVFHSLSRVARAIARLRTWSIRRR